MPTASQSMARLIGIAGVSVAPVAPSLNASFQYLVFSMRAALGSLAPTIHRRSADPAPF